VYNVMKVKFNKIAVYVYYFNIDHSSITLGGNIIFLVTDMVVYSTCNDNN